MNQTGRKIYYDTTTGNVILDIGEMQGDVVGTTIDQDIATYTSLSERVRETFGVIKLAYGDYAQDFMECNGYRVNPTTKTLEFSYPDYNNPTAPQIFQQPLSIEVEILKQQLMTANEKYQALDKTTVSLADLKVAKIEQLNYFCEQDILSGFTSTVNGHVYRTDDRDQTNFIGQYNQLMTNTNITTVLWKTRDVGYIEHAREEWLSIYNEAFEVIKQKLFKYEQLKQTLNLQNSNTDVDIIVW